MNNFKVNILFMQVLLAVVLILIGCNKNPLEAPEKIESIRPMYTNNGVIYAFIYTDPDI